MEKLWIVIGFFVGMGLLAILASTPNPPEFEVPPGSQLIDPVRFEYVLSSADALNDDFDSPNEPWMFWINDDYSLIVYEENEYYHQMTLWSKLHKVEKDDKFVTDGYYEDTFTGKIYHITISHDFMIISETADRVLVTTVFKKIK